MDKIEIIGRQTLKGDVRISGAKNAALPLMCASLLTDKEIILKNIPRLGDIATMISVLEHLGAAIHWKSHDIISLNVAHIETSEAPYDLVRKMRASILALGPLLGRYGQAIVSLPGGCAIGVRPIDIHLKGFEKMGAHITIDGGNIHAKAPQNGLQGCDFHFPVVTVTGTENMIMAAVLANGVTTLTNAAQEPEINDLCDLLVKIGADIHNDLKGTITITGVSSLNGAIHSVIPDRIETGTYCVAPLMYGGDVTLHNTDPSYLNSFLDVLKSIGAIIKTTDDSIYVSHPGHSLKSFDISTSPYPGIATDLQAQLMALMCVCKGTSTVLENIWENRFMHVPELRRFGANITVEGHKAIVEGQYPLKAAPVMATDLRASVSLVLAALAAEGKTVLNRVYHLDRGYENFEHKLRSCGVHIERKPNHTPSVNLVQTIAS